MSDRIDERPRGMTKAQARAAEWTIVGLSILSLVLLFQPFSLTLYSVGAGLVVLAGLLFNLVPLCRPGKPFLSLVKGTIVIALVFAVITGLALGSALLYAKYMTGD